MSSSFSRGYFFLYARQRVVYPQSDLQVHPWRLLNQLIQASQPRSHPRTCQLVTITTSASVDTPHNDMPEPPMSFWTPFPFD